MKKYILSIVLSGLFVTVLNAQDVVVCAKVLDAETNDVLHNATVSIGTEKSTIANADGEFMIEAEPHEVLTVSYVGYKPVRVKAGNIGSVIKLSSYAIELGEVKVLPLKSILDKIVSKLKAETMIYKMRESNFYYRQTTLNDGECCEYIEALLNGYSEIALRHPSIVTGRYGALKNTDKKKYSYVENWYQLSCMSPYARTIGKKTPIIPLVSNSENKYQMDYDILSDKSCDNVIYKVIFTPHSKVKKPIVKGVIYVDADSYRILKYEGRFLHTDIVSSNKERYSLTSSFSVTYTYRQGFMEVQSVATNGTYLNNGVSVNVNSTLFNIGNKYYNGKKKLGDFSNMKQKINAAGYDARFWNDNTIIKRTPMEEQVVKMFEKDNVFSNICEKY